MLKGMALRLGRGSITMADESQEPKGPRDKEGKPLAVGMLVTLELEVCDVLQGQHVECKTKDGEKIMLKGSLLSS